MATVHSSMDSDVIQNGSQPTSTGSNVVHSANFTEQTFFQTTNERKKRGRPKKKDKQGEKFAPQQKLDTGDRGTGPGVTGSSLENEIWRCKVCNLDFCSDDDKLMKCGRCDGPTCIKCLDMDTEMYEVLTSRVDVHWYCTACDRQAMSAIKTDWEIEEKCAAYMATLNKKFDDMQSNLDQKADKTSMEKLSADVMATQKVVEGVNADIVKLSDRIELMHKEPEEIEKRKKNILIKGLPECRKSIAEDARHQDKDIELDDTVDMSNEEICDQLFNSMDIKVTPKSVHRLGKKKLDGKPRPIKVVLESEEDTKLLLRGGPKVRRVNPEGVSFNPSKVFISPDMTILQREEDFKLREELRRKRISDPNWIIRGEKLFLKTQVPPRDLPPDRVGSSGERS